MAQPSEQDVREAYARTPITLRGVSVLLLGYALLVLLHDIFRGFVEHRWAFLIQSALLQVFWIFLLSNALMMGKKWAWWVTTVLSALLTLRFFIGIVAWPVLLHRGVPRSPELLIFYLLAFGLVGTIVFKLLSRPSRAHCGLVKTGDSVEANEV